MTTEAHASDLPWLTVGAQVAVLTDRNGGDVILSRVAIVQRVGKLHVVTEDGRKYNAKGGRLLRDIAHRDAWSSAPYLAELRGERTHLALHQRIVANRSLNLSTAAETVKRALNPSSLAKDPDAALTALADLTSAATALRAAISYDPTGPVPDFLAIPGEVRDTDTSQEQAR